MNYSNKTEKMIKIELLHPLSTWWIVNAFFPTRFLITLAALPVGAQYRIGPLLELFSGLTRQGLSFAYKGVYFYVI